MPAFAGMTRFFGGSRHTFASLDAQLRAPSYSGSQLIGVKKELLPPSYLRRHGLVHWAAVIGLQEAFDIPDCLPQAVIIFDEGDSNMAFAVLAETYAGCYRNFRFCEQQL